MASKLRIAVVDDEASVRKALSRLLSVHELTVETFASGAEFLLSLVAGRPDCLVLDLYMPGLTGLDVLRELARGDVKLPTIIITAHDEPGWRSQCLAAGASAYLVKPLDDAALLNAIVLAIGRTSPR